MDRLLVSGDFPDEWKQAALNSKVIAMDIETSGLDKWTDRIGLIQMYIPDKGTIMLRQFQEPKNLLSIIANGNTTKVFHHAPFDIGFIMRAFNVKPRKIADTKIAAKLYDPKKTTFYHPETGRGSHSLIALVWHYYQIKLDKSVARTDWFNDLTAEQLNYAAMDVEFLPSILQNLERELSKLKLLSLARETYKHIPTNAALEIKKYNDIYGYA